MASIAAGDYRVVINWQQRRTRFTLSLRAGIAVLGFLLLWPITVRLGQKPTLPAKSTKELPGLVADKSGYSQPSSQWEIYRAKRQMALTNRPSPTSKRHSGFRFAVSEERQRDLIKVTGRIVSPNLSLTHDRTGYSLDEVFQMHPFLTGPDGIKDTVIAGKIQSLLAQHIVDTQAFSAKEKQYATAGKRMTSSDVATAFPASKALTEIIRSFESRPQLIKPLDSFTKLVPGIDRATTEELSDYLVKLATVQTLCERLGQPERARSILNGALPQRLRIHLSDDQVEALLATPITELAVGEW